MHATIEEIEAEKSLIEDQAVCNSVLCIGKAHLPGQVFYLSFWLAAGMCLQKEKMEKAIETVQTNFNTVRTGRANPAMLDRIEVWGLVLVLFALMMKF